MSATSVRPGRAAQVPRDAASAAQVPGDAAAADQIRRARLRAAVTARGIPLATILASVAVVVLTYLAGKLAYRLRDIILMILAAGFLALVLNPLVAGLQRRRIRRRGQAVAVVTIWTALVFFGLVAAFGYPLVHGVTHFSKGLPSYVAAAEHGRGWIGHLVRRFHLQAWINRNAPKLQSLGATLARPALTVGQGAASMLATLGTIFALLVLFLLEGPKMGRWLLDPSSSRPTSGCSAPRPTAAAWPSSPTSAASCSAWWRRGSSPDPDGSSRRRSNVPGFTAPLAAQYWRAKSRYRPAIRLTVSSSVARTWS